MCKSNECFFFQAEDGIRDLVRSRGLGDVYKRQGTSQGAINAGQYGISANGLTSSNYAIETIDSTLTCLLYTSDAADERSSVDLGGRRTIKKKKSNIYTSLHDMYRKYAATYQ